MRVVQGHARSARRQCNVGLLARPLVNPLGMEQGAGRTVYVQGIYEKQFPRMEMANDNFLGTSPYAEDLEMPQKPRIHEWNIEMKRLTVGNALAASITRVTAPCPRQDAATEIDMAKTAPYRVLQHVCLKIIKVADGNIKICNPKLISEILAGYGMTQCNPTIVPYTINADLTKFKTGDLLQIQLIFRAVWVPSIIADTTPPGIAWILGIFG